MKPASGATSRFRRRTDELGLRTTLSTRMLPLLVAAMTFLAALAAAGAVAASRVSTHWAQGAGAALTVQVPRGNEPALLQSGQPGETSRLATVVALLNSADGVASARPLGQAELLRLLKPWLGNQADLPALPLPAVIEVHLSDPAADLAAVTARIDVAAPGTLIEHHESWLSRLADLTRSLQACAALALALVAGVGVAVIVVATRGGLSARRETIEIVHLLGATDQTIANRFAARCTVLAGAGAVFGAVAALPVLLALAYLAAPFSINASNTLPAPTDLRDLVMAAMAALPTQIWLTQLALPFSAILVGWLTAQATVRSWLKRLP
jgi:cell division transport system permease protein